MTPTVRPDTPKELLERTLILRGLLVAKARFQEVDGELYERIRAQLQSNSELWSRLPAFVTDIEDLQTFWQFIQDRCKTRAERRTYIEQEFRGAVEWLEMQNPRRDAEMGQLLARASSLDDRVRTLLGSSGFRVSEKLSAAGLSIDFLVEFQNGERVYLELKEWTKSPKNILRATEQYHLYKEAFGNGLVLIVVPDSGESWAESFIVPEGKLVDGLRKIELATERDRAAAGKGGFGSSVRAVATQVWTTRPYVFAAMPFASEFDDVFFVAMAPAADAVGADCKRVDQEEFYGDIFSKIEELIDSAKAVIADVTGNRPNVIFEVGYATGREKPVIYVSRDSASSLPFDIGHENVIFYHSGATHDLQRRLEKRLAAVSALSGKG